MTTTPPVRMGVTIRDAPAGSLAKRVDPEDKGVANCDTPGGVQEMAIINESGMCSLVLFQKPQQKPQPSPKNRNGQAAISYDKRQ